MKSLSPCCGGLLVAFLVSHAGALSQARAQEKPTEPAATERGVLSIRTEGTPRPESLYDFVQRVTAAFAEGGSAAALPLMERKLPGWMRSTSFTPQQSVFLTSFLAEWFRTDAEGLVRWSERLPTGALRDATLGHVAVYLGIRDPAGARAWLERLPEDAARAHAEAMLGLSVGTPTPAPPIREIPRLEAPDEPGNEPDALAPLPDLWRREPYEPVDEGTDAGDASAPDNPLLDSVLEDVALRRFDRAAGRLETAADGPDKDLAVHTLVSGWALEDLRGAATWMRELQPSATRDRAFSTFSGVLASTDPPRASKIVEAVRDPLMREGAAEQVYRQWREQDAAAADSWYRQTVDRVPPSTPTP